MTVAIYHFIVSGGVDFGVHTNTELAIRGSGTEEIDIEIIDNDVYDGEDRKFAVALNLLETDFERVRFLSDDIIVYINDDEMPPDDAPGTHTHTHTHKNYNCTLLS